MNQFILNYKMCTITAKLTLAIAVFSLLSALLGIFDKSIYDSVVSTGIFAKVMFPGTLSQDIISVVASVILGVFSILFLLKPGYKIFITILGLVGYFLYGYGLFVITGLYTSIYMLYMAIFSLSLFSLIIGLSSFDNSEIKKYNLPKSLRKTIAIFLLFIAIMFCALWTSSLIPFTISHTYPDFHGVFVLDLAIVMPAFAIIAIMLLKNNYFGNILAGIAIIKTITLVLSVLIGETIAPIFELKINYVMIVIYSIILVFCIILELMYLKKYKQSELIDL